MCLSAVIRGEGKKRKEKLSSLPVCRPYLLMFRAILISPCSLIVCIVQSNCWGLCADSPSCLPCAVFVAICPLNILWVMLYLKGKSREKESEGELVEIYNSYLCNLSRWAAVVCSPSSCFLSQLQNKCSLNGVLSLVANSSLQFFLPLFCFFAGCSCSCWMLVGRLQ